MTGEALLERACQALPARADELARKLLAPFDLVQPGRYLDDFPGLRERFDRAAAAYRGQAFEEALQQFLDVERDADGRRPGAGRTAGLNAATCALRADRYDQTVQLLEPRFRARALFGLPLWNYAVALYRLGRHPEALTAIEAWIPKSTSEWLRLRATLAAAAVAALAQQPDLARQRLRDALATDPEVVSRQLRLEVPAGTISSVAPAPGAPTPAPVAGPGIPPDVEKLRRLVRPRRPERRPELASSLTAEELAAFDAAVEALAEGETAGPLRQIELLRQRHPDLPPLDAALASCLLFAGRDLEARELLLQALQTGGAARRSGTALWNLACAQIRTGDWAGAVATLRECATTEYRTSVALRAALEELVGDAAPRRTAEATMAAPPPVVGAPPRGAGTPSAPERPPAAPGLLDGLPGEPEHARRELLARLLRPKRLARGFRPDLAQLTELDRQQVEEALDAARQAGVTPAQAVEMLAGLLSIHPGLYTLKAHAAAFAARQGEAAAAARAIAWLREADQARRLDKVSRMNLACCYLATGDLAGVARVLEGGAHSSLQETPRFWLALALARAMTGGNPAAAAAEALRHAADARAREELGRALTAAGLEVPADRPQPGAAQVALECLDRGDVAGAIEGLSAICGRDVHGIDEVGKLEPQLRRQPGTSWNPKLIASFRDGVRAYDQGEFAVAADHFTRALAISRRPDLAINAIAARVKAGQAKRADRVLKPRELARWSQRPHEGWRLVYNLAVTALSLGDPERAVELLSRYQRSRTRRGREADRAVAGLLVAASAQGTTPGARGIMAEALDALRRAADPPSDRLLAALARARLTDSPVDVAGARAAIAELVTRGSGAAPRLPASEVRSTKQVREGFEQRRQTAGPEEAIAFAEAVIEKQERDRPASADEGDREAVVRSVGVELAARLCLVEGHLQAGRTEEAIRALQGAEALVADHDREIPPGYRARNWLELAKAAQALGLSWAGVRFCARGREADPNRRELQELETALRGITGRLRPADDVELARALNAVVAAGGGRAEVGRALGAALAPRAGDPAAAAVLWRLLETVSGALSRPEVSTDEIEQLLERAGTHASMTLPDEAVPPVRELLAAIARQWGAEGGQVPVDARIHRDVLWPRSDEQEGCCTLSLTSVVEYEIKGLTVEDSASLSTLWTGDVAPGRKAWIRWQVGREEGFGPGEPLDDLELRVRWKAGGQEASARLSPTAEVAKQAPRWPSYPTGALSPDETERPYGRDEILRRIRQSLGPRRASEAFFLEAPRRMGKTSILRFVEGKEGKRGVPDHVLPIYVNLDTLPEAPSEPPNLWAFLAASLHGASAGAPTERPGGPAPVEGPKQFVREVRTLCDRLGKAYVFLLLDEFHVLFEPNRAANPRQVLSELKEFHDNPSHRISFLLADRSTRRELEVLCPAELWAQLTPQPIGPLDRKAVKELLETPPREQERDDVEFPDETLERLHERTGGYPWHVVHAANKVVVRLQEGPWLVALPDDVDHATKAMVQEDRLFTDGLCRPERIDTHLEDAIAAVLERRDLLKLVEQLRQDDPAEWDPVFAGWAPSVEEFVAGLRLPADALERLVAFGIMRREQGALTLFSPLLEEWLRRMREEGRRLGRGERAGSPWSVSILGDGATASFEAWHDLDARLLNACLEARKPAPLRPPPKKAETGDWRDLTRPVDTVDDFRQLLATAHRLFVDGREDREALRGYPRLCLAYHSLRLVRNYHHHPERSRVGLSAWGQLRRRALRRDCEDHELRDADWAALRHELLRSLYTGLQDALRLAQRR
jgi:tetratricopeptide (TPR) repeat protein